jgi:hypothetical protein
MVAPRKRWPWPRSSIAATAQSGRNLSPGPSSFPRGETSGRLYVLAEGTVEVLRTALGAPPPQN